MKGDVETTRVTIVEDHLLFAQALEIALSLEGYDVHRLEPWAGAGTDQLVTSILRTSPRIALLDLDLGGAGSGVRLVQPLARARVSVVVLTGSSDKARWGECLRNGACTVVSKVDPLDSILATIRAVAERRPVLGREERERLLQEFHGEQTAAREVRRKLELLTPRECEVLGHLMLGRQVREIAAAFFVSEATVRTQVKAILTKLEVTSQLAAVGAAHLVEWRPPETRAAS